METLSARRGLLSSTPARLGSQYTSQYTPWQPPQYQVTGISSRMYPFNHDFKDPPTWINVFAGPAGRLGRDKLPKNVQWVSAYEYHQQVGQLTHFESIGITENIWQKWDDIHYRLVDSADKYLASSKGLDSHAAAEVWARWNHEADEHLAYHGIMCWRYACFTEANLEVIPPGKLREELRYTAPNDLHPDTQDLAWNIRQKWLPEKYRFTPIADPMRLSRLHVKNRAALLAQIDSLEAKWAGEASGREQAELVRSYTDLWRRAVAPSAHVTPAAIDACGDVPTLQEMFELVFADNGDDRLYAIARRAAALTGSKGAASLADWCAGIAARDEDAAARAVGGVQMSASSPSDAEKAGALLPGDFSEIRSKAELAAFLAFWKGHWARTLQTLSSKERKMYEAAWASFESTASRLVEGKHDGAVDGGDVRRMWWDALNKAAPEGGYCAPPLLPVKRDAHGMRFQLRMIGALHSEGHLQGVGDADPAYLADVLCYVDWKLLSAADLHEIAEEYPGLGIDWSAVPAAAKARLASAGLKLDDLKPSAAQSGAGGGAGKAVTAHH